MSRLKFLMEIKQQGKKNNNDERAKCIVAGDKADKRSKSMRKEIGGEKGFESWRVSERDRETETETERDRER